MTATGDTRPVHEVTPRPQSVWTCYDCGGTDLVGDDCVCSACGSVRARLIAADGRILAAAGCYVDDENRPAQPLPPRRYAYHIDDPAAFWSSLTPAQIRALLAAAPKVAGPWEPIPGNDRGVQRVGCEVRPLAFAAKSAKDTQEHFDKQLRAEGWGLDDGAP